jgi:hypothetical protein
MTDYSFNVWRNDNNMYVGRTAAKYKTRQQFVCPIPLTASQQRHDNQKPTQKTCQKTTQHVEDRISQLATLVVLLKS